MSGSRIKVAGRFKPCLHMGCFDLNTYVELNQRARKVGMMNQLCKNCELFVYIASDLTLTTFKLISSAKIYPCKWLGVTRREIVHVHETFSFLSSSLVYGEGEGTYMACTYCFLFYLILVVVCDFSVAMSNLSEELFNWTPNYWPFLQPDHYWSKLFLYLTYNWRY
jgi:hypothetical protein